MILSVEQIITKILEMSFIDANKSMYNFRWLQLPQNIGLGFILKEQENGYSPELYSISENRNDHNRQLEKMYHSKNVENSISINSFGNYIQVALSLNQHNILFRISKVGIQLINFNAPTPKISVNREKVREELKEYFRGINRKVLAS